jgi:flagellar motor switch protein FliM
MDSILTPSEIDALLKSTVALDAAKMVKPIDLVARDHQAFALLPRLQEAADRFAQQVGRTCTQNLRTACKSAADSVEVVPGSRLADFVGAPRFTYGVTVSNCRGAGLVTIDGVLGGAYVDRQFGGEMVITPAGVEGPPTTTERRTVSRLGSKIVEALKGAMARVSTFEATLEMEPPAMLRNPTQAVAAVLIIVRITIGEHRSVVTVAVDTAAAGFKVAEPAAPLGRLEDALLLPGLQRVSIGLSVVLGTTCIAVSRLMALRAGEIITLDTPADSEIPLLVEQRTKFLGVPTINRGNLSLQINQQAKE